MLGGQRFDRPIEFIALPGGRVLVAEQDGRLLLFSADGSAAGTLLDIRLQVSRGGNEEGLLGVALDPAFASNGQLWVYYSVAGGERRTRLARFTASGDPPAVDVASELVVLEVAQPFANHNGGAVRFGPDRMLYLGLGDGGAGGDPLGSGQDPSTLLGSVLRLDVRAASAAQPYAIPADNPFAGDPDARDEVWAYGLRNPWRMSFDAATGLLWLGDVGQNAIEEIDVIQRGGNYGWDRIEGHTCYEAAGCDTAGTILPVAIYRHDQGCSVTGGVVVRGEAAPALHDHYVYGDFCTGRVWALPVGGGTPVVIIDGGPSISSFGLDAAGDAYVVAFGSPVLRLIELP